jgi:hypothetical protein
MIEDDDSTKFLMLSELEQMSGIALMIEFEVLCGLESMRHEASTTNLK